MADKATIDDINKHYAFRDQNWEVCAEKRPYANYGYWAREGGTINDACDAMTDLMAKEMDLKETDHLLECGCGYGASSLASAFHS